MVSAIILAISPFVLNIIVALAPGDYSFQAHRPVAVFPGSVIATSAMTGASVDPYMGSNILMVLVEAFVAFVLAHGSYTLFWKA